MADTERFMTNSIEAGKLVLRLALGGMLLLHGINKLLHGVNGIGAMLEAQGLPAWLAHGVIVGEVIAPLLIIFGYYASVGGLLVVINMCVAIWLVHSAEILQLGQNGGWAIELQAFYLFGGLAVALLGSGRYAIKQGS